MVTVWSIRARAELRKIYEHIALDSLQDAKKVRDTLIDLTIELSNHPEKYPLDKFRRNNDGTWRAFEKFHFRISYRVMPEKIYIVRLRHTSRNPLQY
jgi:plasmid stabilization system protein ParE